MATNLLFGNNAGGGTGSLSPVAIGTCGQGFYPGPNFGTLEASAGATGTFFKAHNLVQTVISNIEFNCNNNANISPCLDTSWGMIGPAPQDRFENVAVVNYAGVGWEASNDNETIFRDINVGNPVTANALTALNLTATGGTIMLENVYTEDAILDLAAQNGTLVGVNGYGIRFNKNGIGANLFTIIGGQQYNNPSNGNVFWDDSPGAPGHGAALTIQGMQVNMQQNGSIFDFRFGNKLALNELTVTVADGVAYNLLGPNVAGTTSGAAPQILCDSCTFPNTVSLNIPSGITYLPFSQDIDGVLLTASVIGGSGSLSAGSGPFAGTMTSVSASDNIVAPGPVCGNAIVATLSDRTNPSSAKVTAVSTTTFTFSATVGDTVDYVVGCR